MDVNITSAAAVAEDAVKAVMKVEPMIMTGVGMFVPGAAPIVATVQPWIVLAAPYLERALDDIAKSNGKDALNAFLELMQHISRGLPNAQALSTAQQQDGLDASRVGSG